MCYPECKDGFSGSIDWCREKCKDSYHNTGLTCFRPAKSKGNGCKGHCDDGYHNTGCTCFRPADSYTAKAYYRGAGNPLACSSGQDKDAGLCYKQCKDGYSGSGPVCWLHGCHGYYNHSCVLPTVCTELLALGSVTVSPLLAIPLSAYCYSRGLMCTESAGQCASINIEIALNSAVLIISIAQVLMTAGI